MTKEKKSDLLNYLYYLQTFSKKDNEKFNEIYSLILKSPSGLSREEFDKLFCVKRIPLKSEGDILGTKYSLGLNFHLDVTIPFKSTEEEIVIIERNIKEKFLGEINHYLQSPEENIPK